MNTLLQDIHKLKNSAIRQRINKRIQEFKSVDKHSPDDLFKELCFCLLTANFSAQRAVSIHAQLHNSFCTDTKETLAQKLKASGYRFPTTRAAYISECTKQKKQLQKNITSLDGEDRREWLVRNIKGLGYKESSHFLRNIGYDDYAIIDSHILDLLKRNNLVTPPKTLTRKKYLEIEAILRTIATRTDLTLAELDMYLWYMETEKILK